MPDADPPSDPLQSLPARLRPFRAPRDDHFDRPLTFDELQRLRAEAGSEASQQRLRATIQTKNGAIFTDVAALCRLYLIASDGEREAVREAVAGNGDRIAYLNDVLLAAVDPAGHHQEQEPQGLGEHRHPS